MQPLLLGVEAPDHALEGRELWGGVNQMGTLEYFELRLLQTDTVGVGGGQGAKCGHDPIVFLYETVRLLAQPSQVAPHHSLDHVVAL